MRDTKPFTPYVPEKKVNAVITQKEAVLISKLRKFTFGQITVFKANNVLVRIEVKDSQMLDETTEIDLS
jgi:hypothetical protein